LSVLLIVVIFRGFNLHAHVCMRDLCPASDGTNWMLKKGPQGLLVKCIVRGERTSPTKRVHVLDEATMHIVTLPEFVQEPPHERMEVRSSTARSKHGQSAGEKGRSGIRVRMRPSKKNVLRHVQDRGLLFISKRKTVAEDMLNMPSRRSIADNGVAERRPYGRGKPLKHDGQQRLDKVTGAAIRVRGKVSR
jgi:hypothetical protein